MISFFFSATLILLIGAVILFVITAFCLVMSTVTKKNFFGKLAFLVGPATIIVAGLALMALLIVVILLAV